MIVRVHPALFTCKRLLGTSREVVCTVPVHEKGHEAQRPTQIRARARKRRTNDVQYNRPTVGQTVDEMTVNPCG